MGTTDRAERADRGPETDERELTAVRGFLDVFREATAHQGRPTAPG
ncbi:hypothetical protein [Streptomyces sp. NPDC052036]